MILIIQRKDITFFKTILFIIIIIAQQLFPQANFTIIGLPDTQYYVDVDDPHPLIFDSQTQWIVENKVALNIVYVAHLGDCVQNGNGEDEEWQYADNSMSYLEDSETTNLTDGIPYGIAVGNHDQSSWGDPDGNSTYKYNEYFGLSMTITPTGGILNNTTNEEGVFVVEFNLKEVSDFRKKITCFDDIRKDIFSYEK